MVNEVIVWKYPVMLTGSRYDSSNFASWNFGTPTSILMTLCQGLLLGQ